MSYNISKWKTKEIDGLVVSVEALTTYSTRTRQRGWSVRAEWTGYPDVPVLTLYPGDGAKISGYGAEIEGEKAIDIQEICIYGEGSGTYYHEMLLPALKQSRGILRAVLIWEGGEYIGELIAEDGKVTEREIEL